jgi:hypothetical protein
LRPIQKAWVTADSQRHGPEVSNREIGFNQGRRTPFGQGIILELLESESLTLGDISGPIWCQRVTRRFGVNPERSLAAWTFAEANPLNPAPQKSDLSMIDLTCFQWLASVFRDSSDRSGPGLS